MIEKQPTSKCRLQELGSKPSTFRLLAAHSSSCTTAAPYVILLFKKEIPLRVVLFYYWQMRQKILPTVEFEHCSPIVHNSVSQLKENIVENIVENIYLLTLSGLLCVTDLVDQYLILSNNHYCPFYYVLLIHIINWTVDDHLFSPNGLYLYSAFQVFLITQSALTLMSRSTIHTHSQTALLYTFKCMSKHKPSYTDETSEAIWGSVSGPRTLRHIDSGSSFNHFLFYLMIRMFIFV